MHPFLLQVQAIGAPSKHEVQADLSVFGRGIAWPAFLVALTAKYVKWGKFRLLFLCVAIADTVRFTIL